MTKIRTIITPDKPPHTKVVDVPRDAVTGLLPDSMYNFLLSPDEPRSPELTVSEVGKLAALIELPPAFTDSLKAALRIVKRLVRGSTHSNRSAVAMGLGESQLSRDQLSSVEQLVGLGVPVDEAVAITMKGSPDGTDSSSEHSEEAGSGS